MEGEDEDEDHNDLLMPVRVLINNDDEIFEIEKFREHAYATNRG